jgi:hypothetical protein
LPSRWTVNTTALSRRSTWVVVCGRSTSMPCCISGAVTMKMISSTNITSTNGVTLISDIAACPRRTAPMD